MDIENRYNVVKLRILSAVEYLNENRLPANSVTIQKLTGMTNDKDIVSISTRLNQLKHLFSISYDRKHHDGCTLRYKLNDNGKRRLNMLLDRMNNGYDLNLKRKPEPRDWTGFLLLPGLEEKDR